MVIGRLGPVWRGTRLPSAACAQAGLARTQAGVEDRVDQVRDDLYRPTDRLYGERRGAMGVDVEIDGSVMTITLARPERLNAFTREQHADLAAALSRAASDAVRAVVITGAGRAFSVGQDLEEVQAERGSANGDGNDSRLRDGYHPNVRAVHALPKPVIAAVNGVAAGAGLSLAAACDLRLASANAKFVPAFVNLGLIPDSGGTFSLPQLVGPARAFEWLATGRHLGAVEAREWGLVSEVVEPELLLQRTHELAHSMAAQPGDAVAETKRLLRLSPHNSLEDQLEAEAEVQLRALGSPDHVDALEAFLDRSGARA